MTTYPTETPDALWDLFKGSVPSGTKYNDVLVDLITEHVQQTYTESAIESNPQFDERHLEMYLEIASESD